MKFRTYMDDSGTNAVPEPATIAVWSLIGICGVGYGVRRKVKKAVVGVGHADKRQIDHMVRLQLPGCAPENADAADALAIAICHSFHAATSGRLAAAIGAAS